ncbi:MAG: DUF928 domain-containing protein [Symploca sp. SIO2G7]|nr:DUF928 domain-containing protein [Symploca sp. SIO2G7]
MNWYYLRIPVSLFALTLSLDIAVTPGLVAQTLPTDTNNSKVTFEPSGDDAPTHTVGAGTRSEKYCIADEVAPDQPGFMALMERYSETNEGRPRFWVHIPQTVAKNVFFSLSDASQDYYYQTKISLPSTPGVYSFRLPADAPTIESNKEYVWFLGLMCHQDLTPDDYTIGGVIKLVPLRSIEN